MVSANRTLLPPELEPDIVLTQPHASGVDETCTTLVIAEGGSIPLHWMAELIAFSTWVSYGGNRAECSAGCQRRGIVMPLMKGKRILVECRPEDQNGGGRCSFNHRN